MTIREEVAHAIRQKTAEIDHRPDVIQPDPMWFSHEFATAAINAFLTAAAEPDEKTGISWHMRPDEATDEMVSNLWKPRHEHTEKGAYRAMLAAAPEFEWDK